MQNTEYQDSHRLANNMNHGDWRNKDNSSKDGRTQQMRVESIYGGVMKIRQNRMITILIKSL
jgi:hypothetical protein